MGFSIPVVLFDNMSHHVVSVKCSSLLHYKLYVIYHYKLHGRVRRLPPHGLKKYIVYVLPLWKLRASWDPVKVA